MKKSKIHAPYSKLKIWLKDHNITYADLARLLGRSETSIMFKINGNSDFLLSEVQIIKNEYGLNNDIFFTNEVA